ncbi:MAG: acyl-ACP--UDP-N-acetylglucosamine O-acyltransferase [Candidatus Delongbacteria bacterium]
MSARIHPSAVVHADARLGEDVVIGPFAVIEENVHLADGCRIGPHAVIHSGARLARGVEVHQGASVSCLPQDLKFQGEESVLEVGERTVIREFTTLSRGTSEAGATRIGAGCLIMAYVHLAHDCQVGDGCILVNGVQVAGHVKIGQRVTLGGLVAVHQFVRIGDHVFVGGGMEIVKDIPPFILANGKPLKFTGLNLVGLKRRGFDSERLKRIRDHYRLFFGKGSLNASQALAALKERAEPGDEDAGLIIRFLEEAERGIIGG